MASTDAAVIPSLSEQYLLPEKDDKSGMAVVETPVNAAASDEPAAASVEPAADEPTVQETDEKPVLESTEDAPAAADGTGEASEASVEEASDVPVSALVDGTGEASEASAEESSDPSANESSNETSATEESSEQEISGDEDVADETPEIKLESAPADFRFPTTNQTRHCFTRYVEYHRCVAAKGEDAPECGKFAKYYRSLCPGEWVEKWNEQRENGTFPGPL